MLSQTRILLHENVNSGDGHLTKVFGDLIMRKGIKNGVKGKRGASLVEYALLVALIAVVAIVAIRAVGTQVRGQFFAVENELRNVPLPPAPGGPTTP
jgi:pilus assembly protein Flp/PilA